MKIVFSILGIIFVLFAALQWNDPDPMNWIILYGFMAVMCGMAAFGKYQKWPVLIGAAAYAIYAILLFPSFLTWLQSPNRAELFDEFAKMQNLYLEETREFLGLLVCILVMAFIWLSHRKAVSNK